MSSVWVPMEPVEPRRENFCGVDERRGGHCGVKDVVMIHAAHDQADHNAPWLDSFNQ